MRRTPYIRAVFWTRAFLTPRDARSARRGLWLSSRTAASTCFTSRPGPTSRGRRREGARRPSDHETFPPEHVAVSQAHAEAVPRPRNITTAEIVGLIEEVGAQQIVVGVPAPSSPAPRKARLRSSPALAQPRKKPPRSSTSASTLADAVRVADRHMGRTATSPPRWAHTIEAPAAGLTAPNRPRSATWFARLRGGPSRVRFEYQPSFCERPAEGVCHQINFCQPLPLRDPATAWGDSRAGCVQ